MSIVGILAVALGGIAFLSIFPLNCYFMTKEYNGNASQKVVQIFFLTARYAILNSAEKLSAEYGLSFEESRLIIKYQGYAYIEGVAGLFSFLLIALAIKSTMP